MRSDAELVNACLDGKKTGLYSSAFFIDWAVRMVIMSLCEFR